MSVMDAVPLLRAPGGWPVVVSASIAMAVLAAVDMVFSYAAKEWVTTRSQTALAVGVASALVLFWFYASALQYAEMAVVTLGWIVLLQVGLMAIDVVKYGARPTAAQWVAVVVIISAQGYLVISSQPG
ncbi:MAG: hypothetical protein V9G19_27270 [Tetrasphaera sp.]